LVIPWAAPPFWSPPAKWRALQTISGIFLIHGKKRFPVTVPLMNKSFFLFFQSGCFACAGVQGKI